MHFVFSFITSGEYFRTSNGFTFSLLFFSALGLRFSFSPFFPQLLPNNQARWKKKRHMSKIQNRTPSINTTSKRLYNGGKSQRCDQPGRKNSLHQCDNDNNGFWVKQTIERRCSSVRLRVHRKGAKRRKKNVDIESGKSVEMQASWNVPLRSIHRMGERDAQVV